jgi:CelD/BcsL family acetyltransferase involved in cellulose biosynthesis
VPGQAEFGSAGARATDYPATLFSRSAIGTAGSVTSASGLATPLNIIDPLSDARWDGLVARHPRASAFHRRGWLEALKRTYGYEPFVLTTAPAGEPLRDGIVACRVTSWLTGTRLVSLPFADHCDPLFHDPGEGRLLMNRMVEECARQHAKYLEIRPLLAPADAENGLQPSASFCFHELDLGPSLEQLFKGLHKDSIQRKIRRAEKEQLVCEVGCSEELIETFYRLLLKTRRRHQLPPQPKAWFRNLVQGMGDAIHIRVARKNGASIAALLTLRHRSSVIYKYGCSDEAFHQLGGMPFLFWKLIEEGKASGVENIDFGRSDAGNEGLIAFKDKFGTTKRTLTYYRYPRTEKTNAAARGDSRWIRRMFSILPDGVLSAAGRVLYRHIG